MRNFTTLNLCSCLTAQLTENQLLLFLAQVTHEPTNPADTCCFMCREYVQIDGNKGDKIEREMTVHRAEGLGVIHGLKLS